MRACVAALALAVGVFLPTGDSRAGPASQRPPPDRRPRGDITTAENYDEFREMVLKRSGRIVEQMTKRFKLDVDKQAENRVLVREHADEFLAPNGPKMYELFKRGRALRKLMVEEQIGWEDLPPKIKQDMFRRGIELMEVGQKRLRNLADDVSETLDDDQFDQYEADRRKFETRFSQGLAAAKLMAAGTRPPADRAGGREDPKAPPRARRSGDKYRLGRWERYVKRFIELHRLDEVQKLRAMDLLTEYKGKLAGLRRRQAEQRKASAAATATTQPTTQPAVASTEEFQTGLERVRKSRGGAGGLFEQLKAELDKIPTPVQRKLAEESGKATGTSGRPDKPPPREGRQP